MQERLRVSNVVRRCRLVVIVVLAMLAAGRVGHAQATAVSDGRYLLVADSSRDRVVRLQDVDGSGVVDEAVAGEVIIYYDDDSPGPDLSTPSGLALGEDGVYLLDGGSLDSVLVLTDSSGDGDANDAGEWRIFYDNGGEGPALETPNDLAFDASGRLLISDDGGGQSRLLALVDLDGDGDALDAGEATVIYDASDAAGPLVAADPEALGIGPGGEIYLSDAELGAVLRLTDLDGDGVLSGAGEVAIFFQGDDSSLLADPEGLSVSPGGVVFVTDEDTGLVLSLHDADGDGVIMAPEEVRHFVDDEAAFATRDTNDVLALDDTSIVVLDGQRDQVFSVRDEDGDGRAASEGEVRALIGGDASVVGTPSALILVGDVPPPPPPGTEFVRGDSNGDGLLDVSDAVAMLQYLFLGMATPPCLDALDADDDGETNITDAIFVLSYLFLGEEAPPAPFPEPGVDPTPDEHDC